MASRGVMRCVALLACALLAHAQLCELVLEDVGGSQFSPAVGHDNIAFADNVQLETADTADGGGFSGANAADGVYGNSSAVLAGTSGATVGFDWKANDLSPFNLGAVAWGRDNTGRLSDSTHGLYQVEVARDPVTTDWTVVAEIRYDANTPRAALRHLYSIHCTDPDLRARVSAATGVRLRLPASVIVDEFEAYTTDALDALTTGYDCGLFEISAGALISPLPFTLNVTGASHTLDGEVSDLFDREPENVTAVAVQAGGPSPAYIAALFDEPLDEVSAIEVTSRLNLGSFFVQFTTNPNARLDNDSDWTTIGRVANVGGSEGDAVTLYQLECAFGPVVGVRLLTPIETPISNIDFYGPPATAVAASVRNQLFGVAAATPGGFVAVEGTDAPYGVLVTGDQDGVVFTPNPVTVNVESAPDATAVFLTQCAHTGPLTVSFGTPSDPARFGSSRALCVGSVLILEDDAPREVVRGNDFSIVLTLDPPAPEPIEFTIDVSNELVVPFTPRAYFGFGQATTEVRFSAPLLDRVGDVTVTFRAVRQRTYAPVTRSVRVLGWMVPSLNAGPYPDGVTSVESITLVPPTPLTTETDNANNVDNPVDVRVAIDASNIGQVFPTTLEYITGQAAATFEFTPLLQGARNISFTSTYYVPLVLPIEVQGGIFSSAPDSLFVGQRVTFRVSIKPVHDAAVSVAVAVSGSLSLPEGQDEIVFEPFTLTHELTVQATGDVGPATITFSAAGFVDHVDNLQVLPTPECDADSVLAADGATCAECPVGANGAACSDSGVCLASSVLPSSATCGCLDETFGGACEHVNVNARLFQTVFAQGADRGVFTVAFFKTQTYMDVSWGDDLLQLDALDLPDDTAGLVLLDLVPTQGAVDPAAVLPVESGHHFAPFDAGIPDTFFLDVIYEDDSTRVAAPWSLLTVFFSFHTGLPPDVDINGDLPDIFLTDFGVRSLVQATGHDLNRLRLYRWDADVAEWRWAAEECGAAAWDAVDITKAQYSTRVCQPGQYALFVRDDVPANPSKGAAQPITAAPVPLGPAQPAVLAGQTDTTTGNTGVQPQLPDDPSFAEDLPFPEDHRVPISFSGSARVSAAVLALALPALAVLLL